MTTDVEEFESFAARLAASEDASTVFDALRSARAWRSYVTDVLGYELGEDTITGLVAGRRALLRDIGAIATERLGPFRESITGRFLGVADVIGRIGTITGFLRRRS